MKAYYDARAPEYDELFHGVGRFGERCFIKVRGVGARSVKLGNAALHALSEMSAELEALVAREQNRLALELTTAYELSEDEARSIVDQIQQASGRTVEATRSVDPGLIGGIVLQVGSFRADGSVRGRLERLRQELATAH